MKIERGLFPGVVLGALLTGLMLHFAAPLLERDQSAGAALGEVARDGDGDRSPSAGDDDDDDSGVGSRIRISDGRRQIQLDTEQSALAGIVIADLEPAQAAPEQHLAGMVVDTAALLADIDAGQRSAAAVAAQRALVSSIDARRTALARLDGTGALGAKREIASLERDLLQAQVDLQLMLETRAGRNDQVRMRWGAALLEACDGSAPMRAALAAATMALVEFSLPTRDMQTAAPGTAVIGLAGQRELAVSAAIVAPAPGSGGRAQGRAWYAAVSGLDLRRDMRPDVWVPTGDAAINGLLVPRTAVVWRGGQPWYYAAVAPSRYERRPLQALTSHPRGYLLDPAGAPREIVVAGVQALLAEEFHAAIPVEDDD